MAIADMELLLTFLCALDPRGGRSPEGMHRWLVDQGLLDESAQLDQSDLVRAVHARAAISSLLWERHGATPDPRTRPTLEAITAAAPLRVEIGTDGAPRLVATGSGLNRALAQLVSILYSADVAGDLDRLKVCKQCRWPFLDTTRNRSRVWCDMATCGSQQKARAYRSRRASAANQR